MDTSRLKPDVDRVWLFGLAGAAWSIAGLILVAWTISWLIAMAVWEEVAIGLSAALLAGTVARYMFIRLVQRNIDRLEGGPDRACAFSFQAWKSYGMMAGMIVLGVLLRRSAIPREALAFLYETMGGALLVGGFLYFRHFVRVRRVLAP